MHLPSTQRQLVGSITAEYIKPELKQDIDVTMDIRGLNKNKFFFHTKKYNTSSISLGSGEAPPKFMSPLFRHCPLFSFWAISNISKC